MPTKKPIKIWGCKRCERTRRVKWFEEKLFRSVGFYVCRECQKYERSLEHIAFELDSILSGGVNSTVRKTIGKIQKELAKLIG